MLAELTDDLLLLFRQEVGDVVNDVTVQEYTRLWKDAEIYGYMTEACDALARDTEGLYEVISIPFIAGALVVPLPERVLKIRQGRLVGVNTPVYVGNSDTPRAVSQDYGNMQVVGMFGSSGLPREVVHDYDVGLLRFVPTPIADDVLEIQCAVTVTDLLVKGDEVPFAASIDQRLLLEYMKYRAYHKHDAETENLVRAKDAEARYIAGSAQRKARLRSERRAPGIVRMEW